MVKSRKIQEESASGKQRYTQQKKYTSLIQVQLNSTGKGKSRHVRVQGNYGNLWLTTKFLIKMKKKEIQNQAD